ncbi:hypothetical protein UPYG_G00179100 [Umbra pygmaea]|uniref:Uncharacterized protein n=1 Tax=Umbra pygmaea TaxID=75934 RepID=A0ABD0WQ83_UMBPY
MEFPVDGLARMSQEALEKSSQEYMDSILHSNPDSPEYLACANNTQVPISLSTVGFTPLYGVNMEQKVLALFSSEDQFTAVGLYLLDRWWSLEDILKTADPKRDGCLEVKSLGERIVLYILNRVVYRTKEIASDEIPFLCHGENDMAKIIWKDGQAVGFYSVKPSGSLCSSFLTQCYQLPVMDSIFVRKCHRGNSLGLQMLEDFVDTFKEDCLGLKYPLSKAMYKVCEKYLSLYPGDRDMLWEVTGVGGPSQRTNIANKIQIMDLGGVSKKLSFMEQSMENSVVSQNVVMEEVTLHVPEQQSMEYTVEIVEEVNLVKNTKETEKIPVTKRGSSSRLKRKKISEDREFKKVIRLEDTEAELETREAKQGQTTEEHVVAESIKEKFTIDVVEISTNDTAAESELGEEIGEDVTTQTLMLQTSTEVLGDLKKTVQQPPVNIENVASEIKQVEKAQESSKEVSGFNQDKNVENAIKGRSGPKYLPKPDVKDKKDKEKLPTFQKSGDEHEKILLPEVKDAPVLHTRILRRGKGVPAFQTPELHSRNKGKQFPEQEKMSHEEENKEAPDVKTRSQRTGKKTFPAKSTPKSTRKGKPDKEAEKKPAEVKSLEEFLKISPVVEMKAMQNTTKTIVAATPKKTPIQNKPSVDYNKQDAKEEKTGSGTTELVAVALSVEKDDVMEIETTEECAKVEEAEKAETTREKKIQEAGAAKVENIEEENVEEDANSPEEENLEYETTKEEVNGKDMIKEVKGVKTVAEISVEKKEKVVEEAEKVEDTEKASEDSGVDVLQKRVEKPAKELKITPPPEEEGKTSAPEVERKASGLEARVFRTGRKTILTAMTPKGKDIRRCKQSEEKKEGESVGIKNAVEEEETVMEVKVLRGGKKVLAATARSKIMQTRNKPEKEVEVKEPVTEQEKVEKPKVVVDNKIEPELEKAEVKNAPVEKSVAEEKVEEVKAVQEEGTTKEIVDEEKNKVEADEEMLVKIAGDKQTEGFEETEKVEEEATTNELENTILVKSVENEDNVKSVTIQTLEIQKATVMLVDLKKSFHQSVEIPNVHKKADELTEEELVDKVSAKSLVEKEKMATTTTSQKEVDAKNLEDILEVPQIMDTSGTNNGKEIATALTTKKVSIQMKPSLDNEHHTEEGEAGKEPTEVVEKALAETVESIEEEKEVEEARTEQVIEEERQVNKTESIEAAGAPTVKSVEEENMVKEATSEEGKRVERKDAKTADIDKIEKADGTTVERRFEEIMEEKKIQ